MAIDKVRAYFRQYDMEDKIMEFEVSSATVELAAIAVGVEGVAEGLERVVVVAELGVQVAQQHDGILR